MLAPAIFACEVGMAEDTTKTVVAKLNLDASSVGDVVKDMRAQLQQAAVDSAVAASKDQAATQAAIAGTKAQASAQGDVTKAKEATAKAGENIAN
jgi:hypothetical protein